MTFLFVQSYTGFPPTLVNIIQQYLGLDCINEKVQIASRPLFFKLKTLFIDKEKQRLYKEEVTTDFLHSLWKEDTPAAIKALSLGASYFLFKDEILKLAKNNKFVSLDIFTSQISFLMKEFFIKKEFNYRMFRCKFQTSYIDDAASSFSEAFYDDSSNEIIKEMLLKLYQKHKKKEDSELPSLKSIRYSNWEEEESERESPDVNYAGII